MWKIRYLRSARKDAQKIDPHIREKIRGYLEQRVASLDDLRQLGEPLKGQLAKLSGTLDLSNIFDWDSSAKGRTGSCSACIVSRS